MKDKESKILQGKAQISVVRTQVGKVLQDDMEEQVILVRKFETDPAYIGVDVGVTKNMTNYEFLRLDVRAYVPCYTEEMNDVEKQLTDWVDNRLSDKLDKLADERKAV